MRARRPSTRAYVVLAAVVTGLAVAIGVLASASGPKAPARRTDPPEVPLAQVRLDTVAVQRAPFCDAVSPDAVKAAVGATPSATPNVIEYASGDRATLEPGLTDVAHEFGCSWSSAGTAARAWVFAAPVTADTAAGLVRSAKGKGCSPGGVLTYGEPGAVYSCPGSVVAVGLFGNSWVHCELDGTGSDLLERGQRWCVAAAYAMGNAQTS